MEEKLDVAEFYKKILHTHSLQAFQICILLRIFIIRPNASQLAVANSHDDVIKWKYFPRYSPFVRGIHRSPVNSPHKGQWRGALMFSLICAWINGWVNNREAGGLRHHRLHYDVTAMVIISKESLPIGISKRALRLWYVVVYPSTLTQSGRAEMDDVSQTTFSWMKNCTFR